VIVKFLDVIKSNMPFRIPLLFKFAAVKNAVSFALINPVSKQIKRLGTQHANAQFHTTCKTLTNTYFQARSKISAGYVPPKMTKDAEMNMGSRMMAWTLISTTILSGTYLVYSLLPNKKDECKMEDKPKTNFSSTGSPKKVAMASGKQ
jgi:hypothetical protein